MKYKLFRRVLSLLLAVLAAFGMLPYAAAENDGVIKPNFAALAEAASAERVPGIIVLTNARFYARTIFAFQGDYAAYEDVNTGNLGVIDKFGRIMWQPNDPSINMLEILADGLVDVCRTGKDGNFIGFQPYSVQGKLLCPEGLGSSEFYTPLDWPSGMRRYMAGSVIRMGNPAETIGKMLLDSEGRCVIAEDIGEICSGIIPCKKNGKWGLCDMNGKTLLSCSYDELAFVNAETLLAKQNGVCRLIDRSGKTVSELEGVTEAEVLAPCCGYAAIRKNGLWGFCDAVGRQTVDCRYSVLSRVYYGYKETDIIRFFGAKLNGVWHFISADGQLDFALDGVSKIVNGTVNPLAENLWYVDHKILNDRGEQLLAGSFEGCFPCGDRLVAYTFSDQTQNYLNYICDKNGDVLLRLETPARFAGLTKNALCCYDNRTLSYYSLSDGTLLQKHEDITFFDRDREFCILARRNKYAISDADGTLLTDFEYDGGGSMPFGGYKNSWNEAYWYRKGTSFHLVDKHGKEMLAPVDYFAEYIPNRSQYACYQRGNQFGFIKYREADEPMFEDVKKGVWYAEGADFCCMAGLMNGMGGGEFAPQTVMTRAMLVRVLYNLSGTPAASFGFTDVPDGKWFTDAVNWAAANGIVSGVGQNRFSPNTPVTREQLVTILHRYVQKFSTPKGSDSALQGFADENLASSFAREGLCWAVENGIINGVTSTQLSPKSTATRAQVATILMRFVKLQRPSE